MVRKKSMYESMYEVYVLNLIRIKSFVPYQDNKRGTIKCYVNSHKPCTFLEIFVRTNFYIAQIYTGK